MNKHEMHVEKQWEQGLKWKIKGKKNLTTFCW